MNASLLASLQNQQHQGGDYSILPNANSQQQKPQKSRQQNPIVLKTKASGGAHGQTGTGGNLTQSGATNSSINNSKIKLRITQQKTRSSSSISNTQKNATNLSSTQKAVLVSEQRPTIVPVPSLAAGETLKSGTHLKMAQML